MIPLAELVHSLSSECAIYSLLLFSHISPTWNVLPVSLLQSLFQEPAQPQLFCDTFSDHLDLLSSFGWIDQFVKGGRCYGSHFFSAVKSLIYYVNSLKPKLGGDK